MLDLFNNYIIYKPFGVISQFSSHERYKSLHAVYNFEDNVYPVGRLDAESEGLLILTDNPQLNHQLLTPKNEHQRSYWVQVKGQITNEAIEALEEGVFITVKGKRHWAKAVAATIIDHPALPFNREVKEEDKSWIELTLTEGKYHQVRKMTAKVGFPTIRLVRNSIEKLTLRHLEGEPVKTIDSITLRKLLNL